MAATLSMICLCGQLALWPATAFQFHRSPLGKVKEQSGPDDEPMTYYPHANDTDGSDAQMAHKINDTVPPTAQLYDLTQVDPNGDASSKDQHDLSDVDTAREREDADDVSTVSDHDLSDGGTDDDLTIHEHDLSDVDTEREQSSKETSHEDDLSDIDTEEDDLPDVDMEDDDDADDLSDVDTKTESTNLTDDDVRVEHDLSASDTEREDGELEDGSKDLDSDSSSSANESKIASPKDLKSDAKAVQATSIEQPHFKMLDAGVNTCEEPYSPITTAASCSIAVEIGLSGVTGDNHKFDGTFDPSYDSESSTWPSGCYKNQADGKLYFNSVLNPDYDTVTEDPENNRKICTLWSKECMIRNQLIIDPDSLVYSNLGGLGPSKNAPKEAIRYRNVFPFSEMAKVGRATDLIVTLSGGVYKPHNKTRNGVAGYFGRINFGVGDNAIINFHFVDNTTDEDAEMPSDFFFSIFDLDEQANQNGQERVRIDYIKADVSDVTEVVIVQSTANYTQDYGDFAESNKPFHGSSKYGDIVDNPEDACILDETVFHHSRHVAFKLPPLESFNVQFQVDSSGFSGSGRNILFTGTSVVSCPVNPYCEWRKANPTGTPAP